MWFRIFSLLLLIVLVDTAWAQEPVSSLHERAAAERRLVVYGDTNLRDLQILVNAFQVTYIAPLTISRLEDCARWALGGGPAEGTELDELGA